MIVGTTIMWSAVAYYSPSFPRGGEAATFAADVTHVEGSPSLSIVVEHKNSEDTSWTTAGTFTAITGTGLATKDVTGLKEEIRLKYEYGSGSAGDFVHLVVPAPHLHVARTPPCHRTFACARTPRRRALPARVRNGPDTRRR